MRELLLFALALPVPGMDLTGTWRLVSAGEWRPNGEMILPYGKEPAGQLMYDGNGNMSAQIQFSAANADGETYVAYYGTYTTDDAASTVSHKVAASTRLSYRGTTQLRFVTLEANRLTLGLPPVVVKGEVRLRSLRWERVK
ncbi:MAG: lipocalin-like domain-containing protein [Acidobacteria bacterium]|nr:lipocalin-like domain-containing protein [Acidobacteriota bacterium]